MQRNIDHLSGVDNVAGSISAEFVIIAPLIMLFALLFVSIGRYETTKMMVSDAAQSAANAASESASSSDAIRSANYLVQYFATDKRLECKGGPSVVVNTSNFNAGGSVTVSVVCYVDLTDVATSLFTQAIEVSDSVTEPVDKYKAVS